MTPAEIGGIVRAILAALGGVVASKGWVDSATLETIIGAATTIIVAVWSVWAKRKTNGQPLNPV
jgi:hypothetical protein